MGRRLKRAGLGAVAVLGVGLGGGAAYVNLTYERDFSSTSIPEIKASTDAKVIADGAYLANAIAHCPACHGNGEFTNKRELPPDSRDLRGGRVVETGLFGTFYPANITSDVDTGIAKLSDGQLARVIRHGVSPTGKYDPLMAIAVGPMADEDLTALISYLRTLPPIRNTVPADEWGLVGKALAGKFDPRMTKAPTFVPSGAVSIERGAYLANGPARCFGCHTPQDALKGFAETAPRFSGGGKPQPDATDESFELLAPNLTPDPETGVLFNFTEDSFVDRVRKVGAVTRGSPMPWDNFKQMTDEDLKSIFSYLRSLPPTRRLTGPPRRKRGWKPDNG
jgi:mono/diheme cytochrome c family protein